MEAEEAGREKEQTTKGVSVVRAAAELAAFGRQPYKDMSEAFTHAFNDTWIHEHYILCQPSSTLWISRLDVSDQRSVH